MIIHQQVLPTGVVDMKTLLWALSLIGWCVTFVTYHVVRHNRASVDMCTAKVTLIDLK